MLLLGLVEKPGLLLLGNSGLLLGSRLGMGPAKCVCSRLLRVCRRCAVKNYFSAPCAQLLLRMCEGLLDYSALSYTGATLSIRGCFKLVWGQGGPLWCICWKGYSKLLGPLWWMCCGRASVGYSRTAFMNVLRKGQCGLLWDHFGECAVEGLVWATLGPLW